MISELETARSYDAISAAYAERFARELEHKPLDRTLLRIVADAASAGTVADIGCGPGHVTAHLAGLGVAAIGVDISPEMISTARRLFPDMGFSVGSMLALPAPDGSWQALVALYSIIHLNAEERFRAFREFHRVLMPRGQALISFHIGDEVRRQDEFLGHPVRLEFHLLQMQSVVQALEETGFSVDVSLERAPYAPTEGPTRRGYVLARRSS